MHRERLSASRCFPFFPGTVSQPRARDHGWFHRVFPITELETRSGEAGGRERIDSGTPYQTDPLALTYRFDSSRHCLERSLVNSISSGRRKSGFSRDYAAAVISNF